MSAQDPLRQARLATDEELAFVHEDVDRQDEQTFGRPIRSLTSEDFVDLEFLRERLEGVRVVQLGESGHGMGEMFGLKSRLVAVVDEDYSLRVPNLDQGFLDEHREAIAAVAGREPTLIGRQTAWSVGQYIRQQTSPGLLTHSRTRDPSMGKFLRDGFGARLYTVGFYAFEGEAANDSRETYLIAPAAREAQIARYNGSVYQVLTPADQYDALVLFAKVSPPDYLY